MTAPEYGGLVPPPEMIEEEKKRQKDLLELEKTKSSNLYQRAYQAYLGQFMPRQQVAPGERQYPRLDTGIYAKIRDAYADAFAIQALRDILGPQKGQEQPTQQPEQKEGPTFLQAWLRMLERSPERAKEILDKLTEEDLAKIAAMDTQGGDPRMVAMMNAIGSKKESVSDLVAVINALPKAPTAQEYVDTSLKLADKLVPPLVPTENPMLAEYRRRNEILEDNIGKITESFHNFQLALEQSKNEGLREEIKDLREKIPTAENMASALVAMEKERETWAKEHGYTKEGRTQQQEDRELIKDAIAEATMQLSPLINALAARIGKAPSGGSSAQGQPRQSTIRFRCPGPGNMGGCDNVLEVPWPTPAGWPGTKCAKCGAEIYKVGIGEQPKPPQQPQQALPQQNPPPTGQGAGSEYPSPLSYRQRV